MSSPISEPRSPNRVENTNSARASRTPGMTYTARNSAEMWRRPKNCRRLTAYAPGTAHEQRQDDRAARDHHAVADEREEPLPAGAHRGEDVAVRGEVDLAEGDPQRAGVVQEVA